MPGFLLHVGATVVCSHAGEAQPDVPNLRVRVTGQPTVTVAAPYTVEGCTLPPPDAGNGPCVSAKFTLETSAQRITSNGQPLLLFASQAICTPSGTPLKIMETQTRVSGT
jgi:hypothetical protein